MEEKTITAEERKTLLRAQQGELDAVLMYNALAKAARSQTDADTFRTLAAEEGRHAAVFRARTGETLRPGKTKAIFLPLLYRTLGRRRVLPLIAQGEYKAAKRYESVAARFPEVESVKNDEQRHGDMVNALL